MNFWAKLPTAGNEEIFHDLLKVPGLRIERIVSSGQASPPGFWYDQAWDEWVLVLQGEAVLQLEHAAEPIVLGVGDHCWLPAGCRHRVVSTAAGELTVWLAVHRDSTESANGHDPVAEPGSAAN